MRKGRITALTAVALAMLSFFVAACGSSSNDSGNADNNTKTTDAASLKGQTVTLWIMNNGPSPVKDTQELVKPFEAQTGIRVNVQLVGWDVQQDRIRDAAVSGTGPDVTQAGTTQVPFFAALGGFENVADKVSQIGGQSAYAPGIWKTSTIQGQDGTFGIPWFTEARTIYYRKDALKAAGVDPKTAFTSEAALEATLEKLKSVTKLGGESIAPFGGPGKKAYDLVHNMMPWVWDAGGAELNDDATKSTINSAQAVQGVKFATDLVGKGLWDKSMLERDGTQVENQFKGGRLAVFVGGPWVLQSAKRPEDDTWSSAARKNVAVAPMPGGTDGSKGSTFIGGSNLMIFKSSKHKDAAWALIKYLSQDRVQTDYANLMGMFPARLKPQAELGASDPDHQAFYAAIKDQGRSYAPIAQWAQVENAYKNAFGQILDQAAGKGQLSDQDIQSGLDKAAQEANGLLAQSAG